MFDAPRRFVPKVSQWSQRPAASCDLESGTALDFLLFHTPSLCASHRTKPSLMQGKHVAETHGKDVMKCELSKAGQLRISEAAMMDWASILLLGTDRLPACSWTTHCRQRPRHGRRCSQTRPQETGRCCRVTQRRVRELQGGHLIHVLTRR